MTFHSPIGDHAGANPMPRPSGQRFVIHPTIATLAEQIAAVTAKTPPEQVKALRESCRSKVATFPLDHHLRLAKTDAVQARATWNLVAAFAADGRTSVRR
jgi:hypothetical protein